MFPVRKSKKSTHIKLTFTGDIMCESKVLDPQDPASTKFHVFFERITHLFDDSDLVIGNLETVVAGESLGYTKEMYSFNTPFSFLEVIKELPVHLVTTANNHALDRGKEGLLRTIDNLELAGILHTGTSRKDNEFIIVQVGGLKIAFLSFTASTNYLDHGFLLESESVGMLNLLCPQDFFERENNHGAIKMALHRGIRSLISLERLMEIKKRIGRIHNVAYCDDLPIEKINELTPYQEKIEKMIRSAKQKADFVVICPHMGGQFNDKPGSFSEFYMEFFSSHHADLVIGNHPHIIQKMDWLEGTPVFYSLGNFSLSPKSSYVVDTYHPVIGLLLHIYLTTDTKVISQMTITPIHMIHNEAGFRVVPFFDSVSANDRILWERWIAKRLNAKLQSVGHNELLIFSE
jgi:poly-gamma-glutamate capsule biosynthesis protein CapA/YwtB (metallophosphatase superfamily)